ncbi:MAG: DUF1902 domain-containing protein [Leptolyngbyaceae bacterium]|nr:DUF1902 domain-containing protein [Leptolyngbyaceae bacterium]
MSSSTYQVVAFWDEEASVWVATSDDVPGLVTEAETIEVLSQKLHVMIPELLVLNQVIPENHHEPIAFKLTSERQEQIKVAS